MNYFYKKVLFITTFISSTAMVADCSSTNFATTYFNARSTSWNIVRDMVGWENLINRCDEENCWYGAAAVTFEYDQTFRPNRITKALFGADVTTQASSLSNCKADCASVITISGSGLSGGNLAPNRSNNDWFADYFGLPPTFQSTISFAPQIQNFTAALSIYFGFDNLKEGLYARLDFPITHTRWNLNASEKVITSFTTSTSPISLNNYPAGYFTPLNVPGGNLLSQATDFFYGCKAPDLSAGDSSGISVVFDPLMASRWAPCGSPCTQLTRLAAAVGVLGWNFLCCDDYHVGVNLRVAAPTGNRPCGIYLFEPIVGNGHHWEFGAGISAHTNLWHCDEGNQEVNLYFEGNVTHLFKACQTRTFDLCNKPNSRYMLAERLVPQTNGLGGTATQIGGPTLADVTFSTYQFADEYSPVANLTRTPVKVSIAAQTDLALKMEYVSNCGFIWDLGYNLWARSCEKIERRCGTSGPLVNGQTWALKGDAFTYGRTQFFPLVQIALAPTENCADIHGGTNALAGAREGISVSPLGELVTNPGIDNPEFTVRVNGSTVGVVVNGLFGVQTRTSIQPITLTKDLIDIRGTRSFSNKLFTHVNYEWDDCECYTPFLGAGASVEFGSNDMCNPQSIRNDTCTKPCTNSTLDCSTSTCSTCHKVSISQWGAWVKGGVAY